MPVPVPQSHPHPHRRHLINALPLHVPKFQTQPHNRIVKEGDDVRFECLVSVSSRCGGKTTWDKERRVLSPAFNPRLSTREEDDLRVLEIRSVTPEDAGVYRIVLENQEGRVDANVKLDVLGEYSVGRSHLRISIYQILNTLK